MFYYMYVLKSVYHDRIYIGYTRDVGNRLSLHNAGKVASTKPYRPYIVLYSEEYSSKQEALRREKQIKKSGKLRSLIKQRKYNGPIV